jgi:lysophospholipase L1-like esterase
VLVYFAAGQGVTELRTSQVGAPWRGPVVLVVCGLAVAAGLATASSPGLTVPVVAVAGGLLLSPVGISLLTEDLLTRGVSNGWVVAGVGGVVLAAGVVLLAVQNVHPVLLVWLTIGVLVLVVAIASNTEADVIIVAAVVVLVWALAPRDAAMAPPVVTEAGQTVLVAMGDSFISGEGAPRFYEGTNVRGENECRRAPTAYPVLLAERGVEGAQGLVFVACSGARADPATGQLADQISQARAQLEAGRLTPSMVLVSIGGNDAWFGHIATTCVLPGDCSKIGQRWLDHLGTLGPTLDAAYTLLRTELGDLGAPIVVVPYANPIAGVGCEASTFTMAEHRFLHAYTEELNVQIMDAAKRNGLNVATTMRAALRKTSLRLCDAPADQVGVNFLAANPVAGVLRDRVNPRHWFHNSLHPNPRGHQALADVFEQWRARFDELPAPGPEPQPNAGRPVVPRLEILIGDPRFDHCGRADTELTFCEKTTAQWRFDETLRTVRLAAVPLLALAVGAWLLSLAALARLRDRDRQRTSQELMA